MISRIGLALGPLLFLLLIRILPDHAIAADGSEVPFTPAGRATLAALAWMATWWMTEAVDLAVTSLLPIVLFPLVGIGRITETTAPYAADTIFLFLGGFLLALAMQRWSLDRRIAMTTIGIVGTRPAPMIGGFMLATAVLSAFVSNTATVAMMLPIALSVIALSDRAAPACRADAVEGADAGGRDAFARALLLGIAYAASIGGIATIIGSPPNVFLVSYFARGIAEQHRMEISFVEWMYVGVPVSLVMLPVTWLLLTRVLFRVPAREIEGGRAYIQSAMRELGHIRRPEWLVMLTFSLTAVTWITRPWLAKIPFGSGPDAPRPLAGLTDAGIAIAAGITLFLLPARRGERVLRWSATRDLPWGILLLFGGGLSLAAAVERNGVAEYFAAYAGHMTGWHALLVAAVVTTVVIFMTELTSNTATVATLVPILCAVAPALGVEPLALAMPAAIAASCAFMMPVATPPNAIVFSAGRLTVAGMCRAGVLLNVIGIGVVTLLGSWLALRVIS